MQVETRERVMTIGGLVLIGFFATAQEARAYIDPATGSLIIQFLIGGFLAVSWTFRKAWRRLIRRVFPHSASVQEEDEPQ